MAVIFNTSINLTKIPKDKIIHGKEKMVDGKKVSEKYVNITVTINDELDKFENQGNVTIQQSQEERQNKEQKTYLGNGRIGWTNNKIEKLNSNQTSNNQNNTNQIEEDDDLPF
jgi:hypothetical protein